MMREELTFAIPRSLNREWVSDTAWTLSMYLEAVAMLPQIYMFQRQAGDNAGTVEVHHVIRISLSDSAASPFDILVSGLVTTVRLVYQALIGHTIFALGFSRVFELIFWLGSFKELADHAGSRLPGYIVLISQLGHLIIMGDFFYYYFKSISKGEKFILDTHDSYTYVIIKSE